jgi:hypothetical protein
MEACNPVHYCRGSIFANGTPTVKEGISGPLYNQICNDVAADFGQALFAPQVHVA